MPHTQSSGRFGAANPVAEKILDAAAYLFSTSGFRATSIRDIASRAGVNQTTVFRQFKNGKDELSFASINYLNEKVQWQATVLDAMQHMDPNSPHSIQSLISCYFKLIDESPDFLRLMWNALYETPDENGCLASYVKKNFVSPVREYILMFCSAAGPHLKGDPYINAHFIIGSIVARAHALILGYDDAIVQKQKSQGTEALADLIVTQWMDGCRPNFPVGEQPWSGSAPPGSAVQGS